MVAKLQKASQQLACDLSRRNYMADRLSQKNRIRDCRYFALTQQCGDETNNGKCSVRSVRSITQNLLATTTKGGLRAILTANP